MQSIPHRNHIRTQSSVLMWAQTWAQSRALNLTIILGIFLVFSVGGCTGERAASSLNKTDLSGASQSVSNLKTSFVANSVANCSAEDIGAFDRTDVEILDAESLPRGVYVARTSEVLIEKKNATRLARVLVRESTGAKRGEIVCSEGFDKISVEGFDISILGLVKFENTGKPPTVGLTSRQFFFYQDDSGFGAIFSNPKSLVNQPVIYLKKNLSSVVQPGQVVRLPNQGFALKYQRERDGIRARLLIHFDVIR